MTGNPIFGCTMWCHIRRKVLWVLHFSPWLSLRRWERLCFWLKISSCSLVVNILVIFQWITSCLMLTEELIFWWVLQDLVLPLWNPYHYLISIYLYMIKLYIFPSAISIFFFLDPNTGDMMWQRWILSLKINICLIMWSCEDMTLYMIYHCHFHISYI